jgi:sugar lactone lactonase YvrE
LAVPLLLLAAAATAITLDGAAAQEPPPPSAGERITEGLLGSIGAVVGPDGALYVAEAGTGGDTAVETPEGPAYPGLTGRVSRINPETGARTTVADGLPSVSFEQGEPGSGPVDVAFIGDVMYVLVTGSHNEVTGEDEWPNGIYEIDEDGNPTLVVDIGAFNDDNPVDFPDAFPGGNPFAMDVRGDDFFITDGNWNRVLRADTDGSVEELAAFDNVVPTGLEIQATGPLYMTEFSAAPHAPEDSKVVTIALPSGTTAEIASGYAQMIDVEFGPGGNLYVLQFGDQQLDENAPPPPGRILLLENGELSPVVEGLFIPTSLDFDGETAFVTTLGGEVWRIEDFSTVEAPPSASPTAPAPAATATPRTGVVAPDTGTGDAASGSAPFATLLAVAVLAVGVASVGYAVRRARS